MKPLCREINKDKVCLIGMDLSKSKYDGMNYYANKELRAGFKMSRDDIIVNKHLCREHKARVLKHELIERRLMKRGMKYKNADMRATKYEKR